MSEQDLFQSKEFLQVVEASDRAGAIIQQHVRSIIEVAEADAARIRARAREDADQIRREAAEAAARVLRELDGVEGRLGELVGALRVEADNLASHPEPEST